MEVTRAKKRRSLIFASLSNPSRCRKNCSTKCSRPRWIESKVSKKIPPISFSHIPSLLEHRRNILVIGPHGAGKSSFVNTFHRYFNPNEKTLVANVGVNYTKGTQKYDQYVMQQRIARNVREFHLNDMPGLDLDDVKDVDELLPKLLRPLFEGKYAPDAKSDESRVLEENKEDKSWTLPEQGKSSLFFHFSSIHSLQ